MLKKSKDFWILTLFTAFPTFLIWLPFFLRLKKFWSIPLPGVGMSTIVANYDGPLFLVVAKTFYNQGLIKSLFQFPLPTEYYAAHFPLFPILINIFSPFFGHLYSMLFVTVTSSFLTLYFFAKLAGEFVSKKDALWLTFIFSIFPARWLIVRSVGSAEPLFVATIIASVFFFRKKRYLLAGIWGALAQLTKSPGILLFISYFLILLIPQFKYFATSGFQGLIKSMNLKKIYPILLIPFALILLFVYFGFRYGDLLAYFHSGDNIHLFFPPFQIFNFSAPWVGTFWLEEIIFVYLIGAYGIVKLIEKKEIALGWFVGIFFITTLFVAHRDIIRYSLPIVPFLIIAYSNTLLKKEFKLVISLLILPIYLYSLAYISQNVMPISDWAPFL